MNKQKLDNKMKKVIQQKFDLHKKDYNNDIGSDEFRKQITKVDKEHNKLIDKKKSLIQKKFKEKNEKIKQNKRKVSRKLKKLKGEKTLRGNIISFLRHPKVDSQDKILALLDDKYNDKHKLTIKKRVKNVVSQIKNDRLKDYDKYEWNEEKYLLKVKE